MKRSYASVVKKAELEKRVVSCLSCKKEYESICRGAKMGHGCCVYADNNGWMYVSYDGSKYSSGDLRVKDSCLRIVDRSKFKFNDKQFSDKHFNDNDNQNYYCDECVGKFIQSGDVRLMDGYYFECSICHVFYSVVSLGDVERQMFHNKCINCVNS